MRLPRRSLLTSLPAAAAAATLPSSLAAAGESPGRSVSFIEAPALPEAEREQHERYMAKALAMIEEGPSPFASVIVDRAKDEIICEGLGRQRESNVYHGEIVAMLNCAEIEPRVDWRALTLYTTGEPCPMCMSAIVWNRIGEMVYGTSVQSLIEWGANQFRLDSPTVAASAPFYSGRIVAGVLRERADTFYREWAQRRRARNPG